MRRRRSKTAGASPPANEVETIVWLAHTLWRTFDLEVARKLEAILGVAPIRRIAAIEHAFRDPRTHRRLGIDFLEVAPERLAWADDLGSGRMIALGVLTLVRSGYHRQYGLQRIASLEGRLPTAFLLARTNDYVTVVRDIAIAALRLACIPARAADLVACLPLVRRFSEWTRASRTSLEERITTMLTSGDPACDAALEAATRASDPEVRFEALRLLATRHERTPAIGPVLERALAERVPLTRLWAARVVVGDGVPETVRGPLLDRMELDRAPSVRMIGLRFGHRSGDKERVVRRLFDGNTDVRFTARDLLRRSGMTLPQRPPALARLADPTASRASVIGALGALSEVGLRADLPTIERFLSDPRPSVAREARRTVAYLSER